MSDQSDPDPLAPELLARRYLDLWQDQMAAWVNEPAVAEAMAQGYRLVKQGVAAYASALGDLGTTGTTGAKPAAEAYGRNSDSPDTNSRPADRPASAAVPPDGPVERDDRVAERLAALEERILRLEAAIAGRSGGAPA